MNCKWLLITKSTRLYTPSCIQFCEKDTESGVLFSCLNLHGRVPKRSKGTALKADRRIMRAWVRILPLPPYIKLEKGNYHEYC